MRVTPGSGATESFTCRRLRDSDRSRRSDGTACVRHRELRPSRRLITRRPACESMLIWAVRRGAEAVNLGPAHVSYPPSRGSGFLYSANSGPSCNASKNRQGHHRREGDMGFLTRAPRHARIARWRGAATSVPPRPGLRRRGLRNARRGLPQRPASGWSSRAHGMPRADVTRSPSVRIGSARSSI